MAKHRRIDGLLRRQARDIASMDDAAAARFLRAYEDARRDLQVRLATVGRGTEAFTAQHLRVALVQVEAGILDLQGRLTDDLTASMDLAQRRSIDDLLAVIRLQEPLFVDAGGLAQVDIVSRLAEERSLLLHRHSVRRYGAQLVEEIQRGLVAGVASQKTLDDIVDDIVVSDLGVFGKRRYRAELIARMELSRAYNAAHQIGMEELEDDIGTADDPLLKMASEFFDQRNHPFSRALHGRTAPVRGEWFVPRAAVLAAATGLKKRGTGGIVWRRTATGWRGGQYPAHFNDRGRAVPWRASWGKLAA